MREKIRDGGDRTLIMREKIGVLLLAADPFTDTKLRLDEEVRAIDGAIRQGSERDRFEVFSHLAVRVRDLQAVLLRYRPQIVHFAGHGDVSGGIVMGDDFGLPKTIARDKLNKLFRTLANRPRIVVLNACGTLTAEDTDDNGVDFIIGMNNEIGDDSAIFFAEGFYGALAAGETVAKAFEHGVLRLELEGSSDAPMPVLRIRQGAGPATLF
jgi:CHAT domain-containing protein